MNVIYHLLQSNFLRALRGVYIIFFAFKKACYFICILNREMLYLIKLKGKDSLIILTNKSKRASHKVFYVIMKMDVSRYKQQSTII